MNNDGSNLTQLTNNSGYDGDPNFSPDGSNWVDITPPNSFGDCEWGLHFNADGSKIIFYSTEWVAYNNVSNKAKPAAHLSTFCFC